MADLLLELFSEEIPARMQKHALEELSDDLHAGLIQAGFAVNLEQMHGFVTPRRLAIHIEGLPPAQPDVTVEKKGPKTNAPDAALQGFLKSSGLKLEQLEKRMVGKDEVYFATQHVKGQPTAQVLKPIMDDILKNFTWPKSMRWGSGDTSWVRPLHSIICLFDGAVVPVEFAGVKANNFTFGHRFLSPDKITLKNAKDYESLLEKAHVIADAKKRKELIRKQAEEAAKAKNLSVKQDEGLLDEVTGLVEWPLVLIGSIDKDYMTLPPEVLISEMKNHQRYFALLNKDGSLAPHFLITANMKTSDGGKAVIAGNERVLRARLSDGRFFWEQDQKTKLSDWGKGLDKVVFHAKLGTVGQKVKRVTTLAEQLAEYVKADKTKVKRAAELCKADLVTGMVGEFPELQGTMGRYYALAQKEDAAVADAIREHYLPLGPDSPVPAAPVSICVALADKLDTLVGMFAIGEKPTGSKDPFALRRAALGIIRIILENNVRLTLNKACAQALAQHGSNVLEEIKEFFSDRLKVSLKDQGLSHDLISAVLDLSKQDDLVAIVARAKALDGFLATDDGQNLLSAYRRAANILRIEEKKDNTSYNKPVNAGALKEKEEKQLSEVLQTIKPLAEKSLAADKPTDAMRELAKLRAPVDAFFDKILVNADDKDLRANRLALLSLIRQTMDSVANFSLIEGGDEVKKAA